MGQKVNPHGLRVGVIKDWDSRWYADADFADYLVEDYNIRTFLKKKLYSAGVSKIEIERASLSGLFTSLISTISFLSVNFFNSALTFSISAPPLPITIPGLAV